jgi:hypothetical protein
MGFSLKGWQKVAGGRSVAQTTGKPPAISPHPAGVQESFLATLRVAEIFRVSTGGLRYASTTGYYLSALQAGKLWVTHINQEITR